MRELWYFKNCISFLETQHFSTKMCDSSNTNLSDKSIEQQKCIDHCDVNKRTLLSVSLMIADASQLVFKKLVALQTSHFDDVPAIKVKSSLKVRPSPIDSVT